MCHNEDLQPALMDKQLFKDAARVQGFCIMLNLLLTGGGGADGAG